MGTSKIKVAFSYIAYPVAMPRYFIEALERRNDIELWVTGPFTGRQIPWMGGMFLPQKYVKEPDLPLPFSAPPEVIYSYVERSLPWKPDIWIEGNAGLLTVGRPKCKYVVIGTDPHVLNYDEARRKADLFYSMQSPYMKPGDRYLPYGFDTVFHRKTTKLWDEREIDIALVGLPYPERKAMMRALESRGVKTYLENGPSYEDAWDIYNNSKLGLNLSSRLDLCARCFELMAMGVTPALNRVPDLVKLFIDGQDFIGFDVVSEAIEYIIDALANPLRSQNIAAAAHESVQPHSWDARMEQILSEAGVLI